MRFQIIKVLRYARIYGISRALVKVAGRTNINIKLPNFKKNRFISIVGCGQFAFSTISYYLYFLRRGQFLGCYDTNILKSRKLAKFYNFRKTYNDFDELISDEGCKILYIASNHASHTPYAIKALQRNIDVYVEKPVSVSIEQLIDLKKNLNKSASAIYAGYNRPFSKAIRLLTTEIMGTNSPMSINYFISGHFLEKDHWYRNPEEGTRICGNLGHWIDLTVHLFSKRGYVPCIYKITISYANLSEPDDNIAVAISTDSNDIVSIMLTSRFEPFEGINETINIQCRNIIAKINDFREMTIWKDETVRNFRFKPKDVGHKRAIQQPFDTSISRDFHEVELSTLLMLKIKDMVLSKCSDDTFDMMDSYNHLVQKSS